MLKHGLTCTERARDKACTTLSQWVECIDCANTGLHHTRWAWFLGIATDSLLNWPLLNHCDIVLVAVYVSYNCDSVGNLVLASCNNTLYGVVTGHDERHHNLVCHPLLLNLSEPSTSGNLITLLCEWGKLPSLLKIYWIGNRTASDKQTIHLLEVVLQTVVVTRKHTRSQCSLEHVTLKLHLIADFQTASAIENLHIGIIAYNLDDLSHHLGLTCINIANLVLTNRSVSLNDNDVRDDTVYFSCCFHYVCYNLFIISLPSSSATRRLNISRPTFASSAAQRATILAFTKYAITAFKSK